MNWRGMLDASPIAQVGLALMRDATGREEPLAPLRPVRAAALPIGAIVAFWSLSAGAGTSTLAALVAHRSAAGGNSPVLIDLDRWVPSLALRAGSAGATVSDALLRPGQELELLSRWSGIALLPGAPDLHRAFDGQRVSELIRRFKADRAVVLDLGAGADALDPDVLAIVDHLCVVTGSRVAQLQAAFCAAALLASVPVPIGLVTIGASDDDAKRIAGRLPWALLAAIPHDAHLADDAFGARAPTMRAVDALVTALS